MLTLLDKCLCWCEQDDASDFLSATLRTSDSGVAAGWADSEGTPGDPPVDSGETPSSPMPCVQQQENRDRSGSVAASSPPEKVRSMVQVAEPTQHRWDVDDDSLPRVFEIFGEHYSTFRMDLRKIFVRTQGLSRCLDCGERFVESINGFKLP